MTRDHIKVFFAIGFYFFVSISIVFLNRNLFTETFKYPVFISWFQQICGFTLFNLGGLLFGRYFTSLKSMMTFNLTACWRVLPLNIAFVGMIGFSNLCLKYVQVSTYQVARALTLLFNLVLSTWWLKAHISSKAWMCCGVVIVGFVIGSLDSVTLSIFGIFTGAASSLFQATYTVMIKSTLAHVDNDENKLLYYNLGISSVLFFPLIFIAGEGAAFTSLPLDVFERQSWNIWGLLICSGILGTSINFATYLCVRITSPVTFNVAGYAKACMQSLGGILFAGDIVNAKSLLGIILTLIGSACYSKVKLSEAKPEIKPEAKAVQPHDVDDGIEIQRLTVDEEEDKCQSP